MEKNKDLLRTLGVLLFSGYEEVLKDCSNSSRSFMKLLNSDTRLLMVDEPTSALDPIVERDIFQRFQEKSSGKTAIFVTHRFANLAKHADIIV
jgi:ABC-type uncharacterized transport system ATPase subunit